MQNEQIVIAAYEKHLLARIIKDNELYFSLSDKITEQLFATLQAKELFRVYQSLIKQNLVTDEALLMGHYSDIDYLFDALRDIDYSIPIEQLIITLDESRKKMQLQALAAEIASLKDKPSTEVQAIISTRFAEIGSVTENQYVNIRDIMQKVKEGLKKLQGGEITGIATGFKDIDKQMGGLQNSDLIIIAGETSQGKTSLALNIVEYAYLKQGKRAAIISMEMNPEQLGRRLVSSMSEVNIYNYMNGWVTQEESIKFDECLEVVANSDIFIADPASRSIENIIGMIRAAFMRRKLDFVVVDYLQLITMPGRNREEEVGKCARALKDIAKELNKPVVVLSQLNRPQQGATKAPTLSRLRDSGQIEEAADVVLFVYRPDEYNLQVFEDGESCLNRAELIMAKGRNYGTMRTKVQFKKEITKFISDVD